MSKVVFAESVSGLAQRGTLLRGVRALDDSALARHDGLALPEVAPARRHREVVSGHVAAVRG